MTLAAQVVELANKQGLVVTTAESCTGGLVAAAITDIAGSSAMFYQGAVTYSNAAKMQLLNIPAKLLEDHGAVSEHVARAMATGALEEAQADIAVAVTGIAGPGGSDFKPEGRVCFGVATAHDTIVETIEFGPLGRSNVRRAATEHALGLILKSLQTASV